MNQFIVFVKSRINDIRLHIIVLLAIPAVLFIHCVGFGVTAFDDSYIIEDVFNRTRDIPQTEEMVRQKAVRALGNFGDTFYRPVQFATYIIDSTISGKTPWMYHVSNLLIHFATVLAVYIFLSIHFNRITALMLASIFSIHPLFASAVAWIPSRGDILIGLFGSLLFISFYLYLTTSKKSWFIFQSLLFLILMFTKETSALFPLLLIFYAVFVINKPWADKKLLYSCISWLSAILVYYLVRRTIITAEGSWGLFGITSFIYNLPVIPTVLVNFFLPLRLAPLPLYEFKMVLFGTVFLAIVLIVVLRHSLRKQWIMGFGLLWFILFTVPPMFYRLPNADYYFNYLEHRTYLPIIGLLFTTAPVLEKILQIVRMRYNILLFTCVMIIFSYLTFQHTRSYNNELTFFDTAAQAEPHNAMALLNKGIIYNNMYGQHDSALAFINQSIKIYKDPASFFHRAGIMETMHDTATAERDFTIAIMLDSTMSLAYLGRSNIYQTQNKIQDALYDLNKAVTYDSTFSIAYYDRGNIYLSIKQYQKAIVDYSKAIELLPSYTNALINRGIVQYELHNYQGALSDYQRAILLAPENILIYNNMGVTLREMGRFEEAIGFFNKALNIDQNFAPAYYGRGTVEWSMNNNSAACNDWHKASTFRYSAANQMLQRFCAQQ